jgi:hypothetical protein
LATNWSSHYRIEKKKNSDNFIIPPAIAFPAIPCCNLWITLSPSFLHLCGCRLREKSSYSRSSSRPSTNHVTPWLQPLAVSTPVAIVGAS